MSENTIPNSTPIFALEFYKELYLQVKQTILSEYISIGTIILIRSILIQIITLSTAIYLAYQFGKFRNSKIIHLITEQKTHMKYLQQLKSKLKIYKKYHKISKQFYYIIIITIIIDISLTFYYQIPIWPQNLPKIYTNFTNNFLQIIKVILLTIDIITKKFLEFKIEKFLTDESQATKLKYICLQKFVDNTGHKMLKTLGCNSNRDLTNGNLYLKTQLQSKKTNILKNTRKNQTLEEKIKIYKGYHTAISDFTWCDFCLLLTTPGLIKSKKDHRDTISVGKQILTEENDMKSIDFKLENSKNQNLRKISTFNDFKNEINSESDSRQDTKSCHIPLTVHTIVHGTTVRETEPDDQKSLSNREKAAADLLMADSQSYDQGGSNYLNTIQNKNDSSRNFSKMNKNATSFDKRMFCKQLKIVNDEIQKTSRPNLFLQKKKFM